MAVLLHVRDRDRMAARLTNDVDAAVKRTDLEAIIRAVERFGFTYRHVAAVDMLVDSAKPKARSANVWFSLARRSVKSSWKPCPVFHGQPKLSKVL